MTDSGNPDSAPQETLPEDRQEQETEQTKPSETTASQPKEKKGGSGLIGFIAILAFLIAAGGVGAGYYFWQQLQLQLAGNETKQSQLKQSLTESLETQDTRTQIQTLEQELQKLRKDTKQHLVQLQEKSIESQEVQTALRASVSEVFDLATRDQAGWMLKEVEHLLRMAQHRLVLERDFEGAVSGFSAASARLSDIPDPRLLAIRESIHEQIQKLHSFEQPDYIGISLHLDTILSKLQDGVLFQASELEQETVAESEAPAEPAESEAAQAATISEEASDTSPSFKTQALQMIANVSDWFKQLFNDSVSINHNQQKISLFIESQEKIQAYEFLRHKVAGAKYSVHTRNDLSYHQLLNAAIAWLDTNELIHNRDAIADELRELDAIDLKPALPGIAEPYTLLQSHIRSLQSVPRATELQPESESEKETAPAEASEKTTEVSEPNSEQQ